MKVSEFIEWLKTQDQEAIVQVVVHSRGTGYYDQGGNASTCEFSLEKDQYELCSKYWDYTDFRGNQFVKEGAPHYEKAYLLLGEIDG